MLCFRYTKKGISPLSLVHKNDIKVYKGLVVTLVCVLCTFLIQSVTLPN